MSQPTPSALTSAATGRAIASQGPIMPQVIAMLGASTSGVEIANAALDPREAPPARNAAAVGMTEHEHKGSGTPIAAARATAHLLPVPSHRCIRD